MFGWFNAKAAKEFGKHLAQLVMKQLPLDKQLNVRKIESKKEALMRRIANEYVEFRKKEKLNVYKTAQIANTFRWELAEAGYGEDLIAVLVRFLVTR